MPATPQRIAFVSQEARSVVAQDPAVLARWGAAARTTGEDPIPTYFDNLADAQAVASARLALLKEDRRMFDVPVVELLSFTGGMAFNVRTPTIQTIYDKAGVDRPAALVAISSLDLETGKTTIRVWG